MLLCFILRAHNGYCRLLNSLRISLDARKTTFSDETVRFGYLPMLGGGFDLPKKAADAAVC